MRAEIGLTVLAAAVLLIQSVRVLIHLGLPYTNEDNALVWAAAVDYGHLHFRQPNSWGQFYIAILEAGPTWLLMETGLRPGDALMITLTALVLLGWALLAVGAAARREGLLSAIALIIPLSFGLQYSAFVQQYGTQLGRTLAMGAVALVIASPRVSRLRIGIFVFVLGICVTWLDPSTALLLVPVLAWLAMRPECRRQWKAGAIGGALAGAIAVAIALFNRAHPEYQVHPNPAARPSLHQLLDNVHALPGLLHLYRPASVLTGILIAAGLGLLIYVILRSRSPRVIVPSVVFAALIAAVFATPSVHDGLGEAFFPWGRTLLCAPAGLWFIAFIAMTSDTAMRARPRWDLVGVVLMALILASAAVANTAGFDRTSGDLAQAGLTQHFVQRTTVASVEQRCAALNAAANANDTRTVVTFSDADRVLAYGCAAIDSDLTVLFPPYERRVWLLQAAAATQRPSRFLITGVAADPCAAYAEATCTAIADPIQGWVVASPQPMPQTIVAMGLPIIPYQLR